MWLYRAPDRASAQELLHRLLVHCADANVPELTRLARTLDAWRSELLAVFDHPGISNGPTEAIIIWSPERPVVHVADGLAAPCGRHVIWSMSSTRSMLNLLLLARLAIPTCQAQLRRIHVADANVQFKGRGGAHAPDNVQPADQEDQAGRARLPQPRQLPATTPAPLRGHLAYCLPDTTPSPVTTLGCVEPGCHGECGSHIRAISALLICTEFRGNNCVIRSRPDSALRGSTDGHDAAREGGRVSNHDGVDRPVTVSEANERSGLDK